MKIKLLIIQLLLVFILFVLAFGSHAADTAKIKKFYVNASDSDKNKFWLTIASEMNKLAPVNVDAETVLFSVYPTPKGLAYNYKLVNAKLSDLSRLEWTGVISKITSSAKNKYCINPDVALFREINATVKLAYHSQDGKLIGEKQFEAGTECSDVITPDFKQFFLDYGVSVEVPTQWNTLSVATRQNLNTSGDSLFENATGEAAPGGKRTLLAMNAVPAPMGASIRISITKPYGLNQSMIRGLNEAELQEFTDMMSEETTKNNKLLNSSPDTPYKIISPSHCTVEKINNRLYSLNTSYRRRCW